jgi:NAD(P)-dependent dehydrogenase (short-subunit alcohol dehydrogenase family)
MSAHVAIVAGAGGALGRATAAALAASGLTVVAVDRNEHALRELSGGVRPEVADTTDPAAAKSLIDRIAGDVAGRARIARDGARSRLAPIAPRKDGRHHNGQAWP